jgi:transcriptional regulator with XRE-family HTH domain
MATTCASDAMCASSTMCVTGSGAEKRPGLACGMYQHLRAWRLSKNMSLEQVANMVGKKHSTISRWERGLMNLNTSELEALARIYGASPTQLMGSPDAAALIGVLDRTQRIADGMDAETLEQWLSIGERLTKPK